MESVAGDLALGCLGPSSTTRLIGDLPYLGPSIHIPSWDAIQNSSPSSETGLCLHTSRQLNPEPLCSPQYAPQTQGQVEGGVAARGVGRAAVGCPADSKASSVHLHLCPPPPCQGLTGEHPSRHLQRHSSPLAAVHTGLVGDRKLPVLATEPH